MKRWIFYLALSLGMLSVFFLALTRPSVSQPNVQQEGDPLKRINSKAREARNGDRVAIRALADEVLNAAALPVPGLTEEYLESVKTRIVNAEVNHRSRKGMQKPIDERDVARMINYLADALTLPEHAKTSSLQVRHLRIGVWPKLPDFFAQDDAHERANPKAKIGSRITSRMTPLEATYLAELMLQQKLYNAEYQIGPKDERRFVYNQKLQLWMAHRNATNQVQ